MKNNLLKYYKSMLKAYKIEKECSELDLIKLSIVELEKCKEKIADFEYRKRAISILSKLELIKIKYAGNLYKF